MIEAPRPVVMISALTEEGAEATLEAIELGAVDFVAKPGGTVSLEIDRLTAVAGREGEGRRQGAAFAPRCGYGSASAINCEGSSLARVPERSAARQPKRAAHAAHPAVLC